MFKRPGVLPGFWPAYSYSVLYLSLIVLIPLSAVFLKALPNSPAEARWLTDAEREWIAVQLAAEGAAVVVTGTSRS